jgi:hypothetical protein
MMPFRSRPQSRPRRLTRRLQLARVQPEEEIHFAGAEGSPAAETQSVSDIQGS